MSTGIKSEPGSSGPASPVQGSSSARASPVRSASTVPSTPPPTSASTSGSSSTENSPNIDGERGDLIEFYNKVLYISRVLIRRWDPGTSVRIHKSLYLLTMNGHKEI